MARKDRWENPGGGRTFGMFFKCFIVLFATLHFGYLHYWPVHFDKYTGEVKPKIELMEVPEHEDPTIWRCAKKWDGYKPVEWSVCKDPNRTHIRPVNERPFVHPKQLESKDLWPILISFFAAALGLWIYLRLNRWVESQLVWHTPEGQKFARISYRLYALADAFGFGYLLGWMSEDPDVTMYFWFIEMPDWVVVMIVWAVMTLSVYGSDFAHHMLHQQFKDTRQPSTATAATPAGATPPATAPTAGTTRPPTRT